MNLPFAIRENMMSSWVETMTNRRRSAPAGQ